MNCVQKSKRHTQRFFQITTAPWMQRLSKRQVFRPQLLHRPVQETANILLPSIWIPRVTPSSHVVSSIHWMKLRWISRDRCPRGNGSARQGPLLWAVVGPLDSGVSFSKEDIPNGQSFVDLV